MTTKQNKIVIGFIEKANILLPKGNKKFLMAKIDTGASKNSIDIKLAANLNLGPIIRTRMIKSAHGAGLRPVVKAKIELAGKEIESEFTLADRSRMKYKMLIGENLLRGNGFLIDPDKR